jgi:hypothetical protein
LETCLLFLVHIRRSIKTIHRNSEEAEAAAKQLIAKQPLEPGRMVKNIQEKIILKKNTRKKTTVDRIC